VLSALAGLMRLASIIICLIVVASFAIFVVNQASSASTHQQEEVSGKVTTQKTPAHESSVHKAIDEASNELTSPFSSISSGWSSQWAIRGANLLFALIVYGFGLGFLARAVRVRA
jgi:hypothetical protein